MATNTGSLPKTTEPNIIIKIKYCVKVKKPIFTPCLLVNLLLDSHNILGLTSAFSYLLAYTYYRMEKYKVSRPHVCITFIYRWFAGHSITAIQQLVPVNKY